MSLAKQTPLYTEHLKANAKMVDFFGWYMPLHYGSAIQEHLAVRQKFGLFDVSHMTIVDLIGPGGREFLRYLMTRDVDEIKHPGGACYTCMCNEHGGIIDDVLIYYRAADSYRLVFNAATRSRVLSWLHHHTHDFAIGLQIRDDLCIIAIQGPEAISTLIKNIPPYQMDMLSTLKRFNSVEDGPLFISRTGYTGEDGVECILPAEQAIELWQKLISQGAQPCGLAARDSLRLEAGLMLNGQDMNEQISPLQVTLDWTISWKDNERDFIGKAALVSEKNEGIKEKVIGLSLDARAILRHDQFIYCDDKVVGKITSGIFSPSLQKSIAFARIKADFETQALQVGIRDKHYPVQVQSTRFYTPLSKKDT